MSKKVLVVCAMVVILSGIVFLIAKTAFVTKTIPEVVSENEQSELNGTDTEITDWSIVTERFSATVDRVEVVFEQKDYTQYRLKTNNLIREGELNTERGFESDQDATVYVLNWNKPEGEQMYYVRLTGDSNHLYLLDSERKIISGGVLLRE